MDRFEQIINIRRQLLRKEFNKEQFVIPTPESNEDENTFISRCVSSIVDEYGQDISLGICYTKWKNK